MATVFMEVMLVALVYVVTAAVAYWIYPKLLKWGEPAQIQTREGKEGKSWLRSILDTPEKDLKKTLDDKEAKTDKNLEKKKNNVKHK